MRAVGTDPSLSLRDISDEGLPLGAALSAVRDHFSHALGHLLAGCW